MGWEREVPACGIKKCRDPELLKMVNVTESFALGQGEEPSSIVEKMDGMSLLDVSRHAFLQ